MTMRHWLEHVDTLIGPALRERGMTGPHFVSIRRRPKDEPELFRLEYRLPADFGDCKVQLYVKDAYPSQERNEVMLLCWNQFGMSGGSKEIAARLERAGVKARATTNKGDRVVKVVVDADRAFALMGDE